MQTIELKFSEVRNIITRAFPNAKSRRTVKIEARNTYNVRDFWDDGSRDECRFVELGSLRVMSSSEIPKDVRQKASNPFNLPICDVILTAGYCVVEHIIFRGKDMGYRVYVSKERFSAMQSNNVVKEFTEPSDVYNDKSDEHLTIPAPSGYEGRDTIPCPPPSHLLEESSRLMLAASPLPTFEENV